MSQENVEVVKAFTRRFEGGDRDEWREYFDPNVVFDTSTTEMPFAGVYHGHQGIERFFRDWLGTWKDCAVSRLLRVSNSCAFPCRGEPFSSSREVGARYSRSPGAFRASARVY